MNNYFFSRHEAQSAMVEAIGGRIDQQFRGTISAVRRDGDVIRFIETDFNGNKEEGVIPVDSTVVLVGPLPLQDSFLKAGVAILLIPQNRREVTKDGGAVFNYSGLLQIHEINIVTSQWHGRCKEDSECAEERANIENFQTKKEAI